VFCSPRWTLVSVLRFLLPVHSRGLYQIWYPGVYMEDVEKINFGWGIELYVKPK
jgi:hypothetical protein